MNWRWVSLTALLAALVIGYGALVERRAEPVTRSEAPEQPGYYLQDAVITQTQQDGTVNLRLVANRIRQRPQDDSIALSTVRVDYFHAPEGRWVLSAKEGVVPANSRVLQLQGDVELRPADADTVSFLRADSLAIDTEKNIAYSTSSPVQMQFGQHAMTVKSFLADLSSEKIRLESVNGRFESQ